MKKPLPNALRQRPFSSKEAKSQGLSRAYLTRMVKSGALDRLSRGVYQASDINADSGETQYHEATLRCGKPSAICLLSALDHHHLTDEIPQKIWVLVPNGKRVQDKQLKLIRSRNPHWEIGVHKTRHYWVTTLERTLIDCLVYKRMIGSQVALAAIKRALSQKKVKLGHLYDMGKRMGVAHRVHSYIEALAT